MVKNKISVTLSLSFILSILILFLPGCKNENTNQTEIPQSKYYTYEMKADDYRLKRINQPLFSFEYPIAYGIHVYDIEPDVVIAGQSELGFWCYKQDSPYLSLYVKVNELSASNYDNEKNYYINRWFSGSSVDNSTMKKVMVSGIEANYFASTPNPSDFRKQYIHRLVVFDYAGLMWQIYMMTYSTYPEPLECQESFNHIINTFKLLDTNYNNDSTTNLNITIEYGDGVFYLTNNEDVMLCEVKVILNYIDNNLSTGYESHDIAGIRSHETRQIQNRELKDINGKTYVDNPDNHPFIMLVQAEFAGCVNKTYTYLKTWE